MKAIISLSPGVTVSLPDTSQKHVLVGGCFDILHPGHLQFLAAAKELGDELIVLLESDEAIRTSKGHNRPRHTQQERAENLLHSTAADKVILLPFPFQNSDYDQLVTSLKPAIIATTKGDPYRHHKERQAQKIGSTIVDVIERIPHLSTTNLINSQTQ